MPKHMHARDGGQQFFQISEAFRHKFGAKKRVAGDIRFGCRVVPHQPISHWVCHSDADDGNGGRGLLCAALIAGVPEATITSTPNVTSSFARSGSRSVRPSARRNSYRMFWLST